jgi:Zn-finger nucleic acid-binding protein
MKCPVCSVDLTMAERQGVEIDYCPKCRGVWLDRGELDKIIERAGVPASTRPEPYRDDHGHRPEPYRDDHGREQDPRLKRKKSFLENLFD